VVFGSLGTLLTWCALLGWRDQGKSHETGSQSIASANAGSASRFHSAVSAGMVALIVGPLDRFRSIFHHRSNETPHIPKIIP
jgi:hypothetical protein